MAKKKKKNRPRHSTGERHDRTWAYNPEGRFSPLGFTGYGVERRAQAAHKKR